MNYEKQADKLSEKIIKHCDSHNVKIDIRGGRIIKHGNRYVFDIKIKRGTKVALLRKCLKDIQMSLKLPLFEIIEEGLSLKIVASEDEITETSLMKILKSPSFAEAQKQMNIPFAIGYDSIGDMVIADLAAFPHLLDGGSSNSGKTLSLKALIMSIAYGCSASKVNLIIFDVGAADLSLFNGLSHLSCPVVKEIEEGIMVILKLKEEMDRRIRLKETDIAEFKKLPYIVCAIDEFPSFISDVTDKRLSKLLTEAISSLLRRGRHANICMVIAAQNPTLQNMKCELGNITARMAFKCAKSSYSQTIIGQSGAEDLLGKGSMLLKLPQDDMPRFVQGAFISPATIKKALNDIRFRQFGYLHEPNIKYKFEIKNLNMSPTPKKSISADDLMINNAKHKQDRDDDLIAEIIMYSLELESVSCKMIEDTFRLGYRRANSFLEKLNELGILGDLYAKLPRTVLPVRYEDLSPEIVDFLEYYGYSKEHIEMVLLSKTQNNTNL